MKVAFYTLGCKVNTYETDAVLKLFIESGYEKVSFDDIADVYVINTCTVTNSADSKSRKVIRRAVKQNEDAIICVMGCYAQTSLGEVEGIEGVDIIIGTHGRNTLIDLVEEFRRTNKSISKVQDIFLEKQFESLKVAEFEKTRAFLKIQDGCNNFCSYCIIPFARGTVRSRDFNEVVEQAIDITNKGYGEIVLTGIHTGNYGSDLGNSNLSTLIGELLKIEKLDRLRISSIEINEIDDEFVKHLSSNKFAKHLHLPLQSGSDKVLKDMNRKYLKENFKAKLDEIRNIIPDISITTDLIVGYPSETEEDFNETFEFLKECNFSDIHVFPYSQRKGTKAAEIREQVSGDIKRGRVNKIMLLSSDLNLEYSKMFIGKKIDLIPEEIKDNNLLGHSSNYLKVTILNNDDESLIGNQVNVKIVSADYGEVIGILV